MTAQRRLRLALFLFWPCAAILAGVAARIPGPEPDAGDRVAVAAGPETAPADQGADPRRQGSQRAVHALGAPFRQAGEAARRAVEKLRAAFPEKGVFRALGFPGAGTKPSAGETIQQGSITPAGPAGVIGPAARSVGPSGAAPDSVEQGGGEPTERGLSERQAALKAAVATALRARHRIKSPEELRLEALIEAVYREYFREYTIAGSPVAVRMPFGVNGERAGSPGYEQQFYLGGKGTPSELWSRIEGVLASRELAGYLEALSLPGEKVVVFDLEQRSYQLSRDPELVRSLRSGSYPGTPTQVFVYRYGPASLEVDLYNYLYAVASLGVDCSGLVHYVHQSVAKSCGADLERELATAWRIRPRQVRFRIGLWFYDPAAGYTEPVVDRIEDLRPADLLLFEGSDGSFKHSAVIQSVDFENGLIRYIQSTDWAAQTERGVHQSLIRFDPAHPEVDLRHYSVRWLQQVRPPFEGELEPRDWLDDGDRYLWYLDAGGSRVVRLKALAETLREREPQFYTNLYQEQPEEESTDPGEPPSAPAQPQEQGAPES